MVPVDSKLYKKFKDKPNFQAFADNQMGELIKAQQRGYNKKFFKPENTNLKPSNLYQEYLKKTGILRDPSISNTNNRGKINKIILKILKMKIINIINHIDLMNLMNLIEHIDMIKKKKYLNKM